MGLPRASNNNDDDKESDVMVQSLLTWLQHLLVGAGRRRAVLAPVPVRVRNR